MEINKIIQGDTFDVLKNISNDSIDCVITSPPYYSLRDYNIRGQIGLESTFEEYIEKLCDIFDEIKRILKPEGTCFINLGDTYASGGGRGVDQSFQRNKNIETKKDPNDSPKSKLRKTMGKSLLLIPPRFAIVMVKRGWILRNTIIWKKPDCCPESVKDRFTNDQEYIFFFTKNPNYYFGQQFEPIAESTTKRDRYTRITKGKDGPYAVVHDHETPSNPEGRNRRCVWEIPTASCKEAHFATFPIDLISPLIKAGCPKGGVILDPFMGSGTTAIGALKFKRNWLGIELNPEYIEIAEKRIKKYINEHRVSLGV
jgi:site-specific DNA-methyltransferase (adenine-specific)